MALYSSICFGLLLAFLPAFQGQAFMAKDVNSKSLRAELKGVLGEVLGMGHGISRDRVIKIRAKLSPIFNALPKNNKGHLSAPVMRYVVQRYFGQSYGWIVKGFEPHAEIVNTSDSSENIFQGKVPSYIRSVLEEQFAHEGFGFEDVVAMVAAIERLSFDEVVRGVEVAFSINNYSHAQALDYTELMDIISSYLILEMLDGASDQESHLFDKEHIRLRYPHWDITFLFLIDIASSDSYQRKINTNPFKQDHEKFFFSDVVRMAERVSGEFGHWSNHECNDMKAMLVEKDVHGTGRVKLADFYRKSDDEAWQFEEPSEYLRQLGVLDESSPSLGPQVLISNYITGMSNCISSAAYYSVCCVNECDHIYQHLEREIASSFATPSQVISALGTMPYAPNISALLRTKIQEIGELHRGQLPLHGRLMAQWLHHAFPHDCPYPHEQGTITPKTPQEWKNLMGDEQESISDEEVAQHLASESQFGHVTQDDIIQRWMMKESMLEHTTPSDKEVSFSGIAFRFFVQVLLLVTFLGVILREARRIIPNRLGSGRSKKAIEYDV